MNSDDPTEQELELAYANLRVREAEDAEMFYHNAAILIRRARELSDDELAELADRISTPWRRSRGRAEHKDVRLWVWAECFTFVGKRQRGNGDPRRPTKAEAISDIMDKYGMKRDAARKLYEKVEKSGPPKQLA